jgi:hypothetical protein
MDAQTYGGRLVRPAWKLAGICFAVAVICCLVVPLIGRYRSKRHWIGAITAWWQRALGISSPMHRTVAVNWQDTWSRVRVAGGLALFAGLVVVWFGLLVGARGPLVLGAVLAVGLVVFPLVYLLWGRPDAW